MAYRAWNKASLETKRGFFELIRQGWSAQAASLAVGVSPSAGSLWFIDAGQVAFIDQPISARFLTQDDRIEIADGLGRGEPVKQIAARIGRSYQTVYREIARGRKPDGRYQPWWAHGQAHLRRKRPKARLLDLDRELAAVIDSRLRRGWSPAQISRWLRRRWPKRKRWHVCTETIYDAVYRGLILPPEPRLLRTKRTYRHRRGRGRTREGALKQLTAMKSIHDRPAHVEDRKQVGHWEGDLIIGAGLRSAVATLIERRTRYTMLVPLPAGHTAPLVAEALIAAFASLPNPLRRTLTWDQGNEMFQHERIEAGTGLRIYFADPHSPWQRGSNENANGLIRQYLPKGANLHDVAPTRIAEIAELLNTRPRLVLDDRTPAQLMRRWHRTSPAIRNDP